MTEEIQLLALLIFGHMLADYPLQGDFLSKAKNRLSPIPGVPWYQALAAHSVIHAGFVGIITGNLFIAIGEFMAHCLIDDAKCSGKLSFNQDQALHIACKALWVVLAVWALKGSI